MFRHYLKRLLSRSSSTPARRPQGFRPRLETLEDRCVPAFTASFNPTTGALTVTGTAAAEGMVIQEAGNINEAGAQGYYALSNVDGSLFFYSSSGGVKSIAIDTQGAPGGTEDTVTLRGVASSNSYLTGALSITGAGGLSVGFGSNFNVRGAVAISTTSSAGRLTVQTGTLADPVSQTNVTLGATTITNRGAGGTRVQLFGINANDVGIAGALSAALGSGINNIFDLDNVTIAGGVTETGGGTADFVRLYETNVGGFVSVNGTAANSAIDVILSGSTIGTFFSVSSGNGNDDVTVNNTAVLGLGLQPQQQTFGVDLKGGVNKSEMGAFGPNSKNVIHGSLFYYGAGTETFDLKNYTITSFVTVNAQAGNAGITATIADSKISNFLSFAAVGANRDNVTVRNLTIGQNFAMDLGGGANTTAITNNTYLGSYSEVDAGNNRVTFTGNTGFGDVRLSGNTLRIADGMFLNNRIAGHASFTSTVSGGNVVVLGPAFGVAISAANVVSIGKTLTINLGANGDVAHANNVIVKGDVAVTAHFSALTNTSVGGNLTFSAGAASNNLRVRLGVTDAGDTPGGVRVVGDLAVTTGSGLDLVELVDVTVFGTTTINTNGDSDFVNFENQSGNPGPSQFFGAVQVGLGNGNDSFKVGTDAANSAQFFSTVLFAGGDGNDTLTDPFAYYYGGPPTRNSFP